MDNRVNYALVGGFVIGMVAVLVFIGVWLSTQWSGKSYNTYAVYMTESVSGLAPDSAVKYNGVAVGYIIDISIDPMNPQSIRLLIKLQDTVPVNQSTTATLIERGLTGVSFIEINTQELRSPRIITPPGQLYPVIKTKPSLFKRLDRAVNELIVRLNKMLDSFDKTFDENTQKSIHKTITNLDKITTVFAKNTKTLEDSIHNANDFFKNGSAATQQLNIGLRSFNGETLPQANQFLSRLNIITDQIHSVSSEFEQNPSILMRGKVPPSKGPGE